MLPASLSVAAPMPRPPLGLVGDAPRAPAPRRRARRLVLSLCGLLSSLGLAAASRDGLLHPLAVLAGLLPLQLAGLLWAVVRSG